MRIFPILASAAFVTLFAAGNSLAAQSSGQKQAPSQSQANDKGERLICRSVEETGSLARKRRQCFTRAQWDRIAEAARARGQNLATGMTSAGDVSN